jgi:hypothetical protein
MAVRPEAPRQAAAGATEAAPVAFQEEAAAGAAVKQVARAGALEEAADWAPEVLAA